MMPTKEVKPYYKTVSKEAVLNYFNSKHTDETFQEATTVWAETQAPELNEIAFLTIMTAPEAAGELEMVKAAILLGMEIGAELLQKEG